MFQMPPVHGAKVKGDMGEHRSPAMESTSLSSARQPGWAAQLGWMTLIWKVDLVRLAD